MWAAAAVAAIGIAGVALHLAAWAEPSRGTWRLAGPMGYANAAAALLAMALAPATLAVHRRATPAARGALMLIMTGLAATMSRSGALAALVALAGVIRFTPISISLLGRPFIGSALAGAGLLPSVAGTEPSPLPAALGLLAGLVVGIGRPPASQAGRRMLAGGCVGVAVLGMALVALSPVAESRFSLRSENRLAVWSLAADEVGRGGVFGTGPGTLQVAGAHDGAVVLTPYAHNEYLQALTETGLAGLVAVGAALSAFALAAWRGRRRQQVTWAAAFAGCSSFAVHSAFDFVWRFPLLVVVAFTLLAVATTGQGKENKWQG